MFKSLLDHVIHMNSKEVPSVKYLPVCALVMSAGPDCWHLSAVCYVTSQDAREPMCTVLN